MLKIKLLWNKIKVLSHIFLLSHFLVGSSAKILICSHALLQPVTMTCYHCHYLFYVSPFCKNEIQSNNHEEWSCRTIMLRLWNTIHLVTSQCALSSHNTIWNSDTSLNFTAGIPKIYVTVYRFHILNKVAKWQRGLGVLPQPEGGSECSPLDNLLKISTKIVTFQALNLVLQVSKIFGVIVLICYNNIFNSVIFFISLELILLSRSHTTRNVLAYRTTSGHSPA